MTASDSTSADRDDGEAPASDERPEGYFNAFLDLLTGPGLRLWDAVEETDVRFTTSFKKAGGFGGTAIDATYSVKKLSDQIGAWGFRWGWEVKSERLDTLGVGEDQKVIHSLVLRVWFAQPDGSIRHVEHAGATTVAYWSRPNKPGEKPRFVVTEDFVKMSITDAAGKAMAQMGVNADVYLGRFDSSKQVRFQQEEARHARHARDGNGAAQADDEKLIAHARSILLAIGQAHASDALVEQAKKVKGTFGEQPFWVQIVHADRDLAAEIQQKLRAKAEAHGLDLTKV